MEAIPPPSDERLPPEGIFDSRESLAKSINEWAAARGYAFITGRSNTEYSGRLTVMYACDRAGSIPDPDRPRQRRTASRKTACPYSVLAKQAVDGTWALKHRPDPKFATHNHEPSLEPSSHPIHRRLKPDELAEIAKLVDIMQPKEIMGILYQRGSCATKRDVYNAIAEVRRQQRHAEAQASLAAQGTVATLEPGPMPIIAAPPSDPITATAQQIATAIAQAKSRAKAHARAQATARAAARAMVIPHVASAAVMAAAASQAAAAAQAEAQAAMNAASAAAAAAVQAAAKAQDAAAKAVVATKAASAAAERARDEAEANAQAEEQAAGSMTTSSPVLPVTPTAGTTATLAGPVTVQTEPSTDSTAETALADMEARSEWW